MPSLPVMQNAIDLASDNSQRLSAVHQCTSVVFPAPRNPVMIVTGSFGPAGLTGSSEPSSGFGSLRLYCFHAVRQPDASTTVTEISPRTGSTDSTASTCNN